MEVKTAEIIVALAIHLLGVIASIIVWGMKINERITKLEAKVDLVFGWFQTHIIKRDIGS